MCRQALEPPQNDDNRNSEYPPLPIVGAVQLRPPGLVVVSPFYFGRQSREFVMTYEIHPTAEAFPMMDTKRFEELKADIAAHGLREEGPFKLPDPARE
jgi:hypothetical protein